MKEKIKALQNAKVALEEMENDLKARKKRFEDETKELKDKIMTGKEKAEALEAEVETIVLKDYEQTGNKSFPGGIGVRVYSELKYDPDRALQWAMDKGMFLKLDIKPFEKAADSLKLDFVTTEKTPKMTIPTKGISNEGLDDGNENHEEGDLTI